jgi:hypothetical protein
VAWTNIFDLGEWDVYVQFGGQTSSPTPPSRTGFVPIAELDPTVGTVSIVDGEIVCDMEPLGFAPTSQTEIAIMVMPAGVSPPAAPARLSMTLDGAPYEVRPDSAYAYSSELVIDQGDGSFAAQTGALTDILLDGPITDYVYAGGDLPSGEGLVINARYSSGEA